MKNHETPDPNQDYGCSICSNPAWADLEWGSKPQRAMFCQECIKEMWERFSPAVNAGLMHYRIGPVGSIVVRRNV